MPCYHYTLMKQLKEAVSALLDLLIPEEARLKRILKHNDEQLFSRLPKPRPIEVSGIHALFDYRDSKVRLLIRALKYRGNREVVRRLGRVLYEEIIELTREASLFEAV